MGVIKRRLCGVESTGTVLKKKSLCTLLALVAATAICLLPGCGDRSAASPSTPKDPEPTVESDQTISRLDDTLLLSWLKEKYTFRQILELGYELEFVENMVNPEFPDDNNRLYKIKDTEIYLSMVLFYNDGDNAHWLEDRVLVGIAAPAETIAPALIGEECLPVHTDNAIYWPKGYLFHYGDGNFVPDYFPCASSRVSEDTMVGVIYKNAIFQNAWSSLVESTYGEIVRLAAKETYAMGTGDRAEIAAQNDTHYLVRVFAQELTAKDVCAWYRIEKESKAVTFIKSGAEAHLAEDIARLHPDIAEEFPAIYADGTMDSADAESEVQQLA